MPSSAVTRRIDTDGPSEPTRAGRARRPRTTAVLDGAASQARLAALVRLLADGSPTVWSTVRRELEQAGPAALPALRRAARSSAPDVRGRARTILAALQRRSALRRLMRYACRERIDLERALLLLGCHHTPRLDPRPYLRALDAMALEVTRRAQQKADDAGRAMTLVEYLGGELGFAGSQSAFHHPDNIHLHRALERRAGMPLTLCAVYLSVARRAGLGAGILPLPGHVMLRLDAGEQGLIVDPYHGGRTRTQKDCIAYLSKHGLTFRAAWLEDADDRSLLRRQLLNLTRSAEKRGLKGDARELRKVLLVLDRGSP
jgi:regulator of sirC expression with transglutaminase-like and TPR domain